MHSGSKSARDTFWQSKGVFFDFDGVVVDSNPVKFDCFFELLPGLDRTMAELLATFLNQKPHATRFEVVDFIVEQRGFRDDDLRDQLLANYSECTKSKITALEVSPALSNLRENDTRAWALISATEEHDMGQLAAELGIDSYFELGVFGSPKSKEENLHRAIASSHYSAEDFVMLGDRRSDKLAAQNCGVQFIFVYGWSDATGQDLKELRNLAAVKSLSELLPSKFEGSD